MVGSLAAEIQKFVVIDQPEGKVLQPYAALGVVRILKLFPHNIDRMLPALLLSKSLAKNPSHIHMISH